MYINILSPSLENPNLFLLIMASSPQSFCYIKPISILYIILSVIFVTDSSAATRLISNSENFNQHWTKQVPGDQYQNMIFTMLPKGVPVPPSGPSNRHNSVVSTSPHNWKNCWTVLYCMYLFFFLIFNFLVFFSPKVNCNLLEDYYLVGCTLFVKWILIGSDLRVLHFWYHLHVLIDA